MFQSTLVSLKIAAVCRGVRVVVGTVTAFGPRSGHYGIGQMRVPPLCKGESHVMASLPTGRGLWLWLWL